MSETPKRLPWELPTAEEAALTIRRVLDQHLHSDHPAHGALASLEGTLATARRERDEARALNAESFCCGGDDACAGGTGCQCHALRAEVESAKPAMREYAAKNPRHHFGETWQDPCGVHAWLERNDKPEPTT